MKIFAVDIHLDYIEVDQSGSEGNTAAIWRHSRLQFLVGSRGKLPHTARDGIAHVQVAAAPEDVARKNDMPAIRHPAKLGGSLEEFGRLQRCMHCRTGW